MLVKSKTMQRASEKSDKNIVKNLTWLIDLLVMDLAAGLKNLTVTILKNLHQTQITELAE